MCAMQSPAVDFAPDHRQGMVRSYCDGFDQRLAIPRGAAWEMHCRGFWAWMILRPGMTQLAVGAAAEGEECARHAMACGEVPALWETWEA